MNDSGWVKLYRKTMDSSMYKSLNSKQRDVMINCLLLANHSNREWEWGDKIYKCMPGQFITSIESLRGKCGKDVTTRNVRTALLKLEKWKFLTSKSTNTGRLITIINWDTYQYYNSECDKHADKEVTNHRQSTDKALTTNKNVKNDKNEENGIFVDTEGIDQLGSVISLQVEESETPSIQPDRDLGGGKEINANDVKKWLIEGIEKNYPAGSSALMEWGAKQGKLAKELLRIYGAETTKKTVLLFCRNWDRIVRDSKMQKGGLPTIEMLWAMRVRVFADVELERDGWRDEYAQVGGVGVL